MGTVGARLDPWPTVPGGRRIVHRAVGARHGTRLGSAGCSARRRYGAEVSLRYEASKRCRAPARAATLGRPNDFWHSLETVQLLPKNPGPQPAREVWSRGCPRIHRLHEIRTNRGFHTKRAVAQLGSAPVWGTGGRRFKSCQPDQNVRWTLVRGSDIRTQGARSSPCGRCR